MAISGPITSARLRLVDFEENHLTERYAGWLNDPVTTRFSEQRHRRHSVASCRAYWQSMRTSPHYFWAVESCDPPLGHVGNISAYVDGANRVADLAIVMGEPAARGLGLGLEAWTAALGWLLGPGGMRKVTAGTMSVNEPMLAVMRASGMHEEGRRVRQFMWEGEEADAVLAGIFASGGTSP